MQKMNSKLYWKNISFKHNEVIIQFSYKYL
nr:MAG TPA: hypothetical protein [Caudoviricetes sp.]